MKVYTTGGDYKTMGVIFIKKTFYLAELTYMKLNSSHNLGKISLSNFKSTASDQ